MVRYVVKNELLERGLRGFFRAPLWYETFYNNAVYVTYIKWRRRQPTKITHVPSNYKELKKEKRKKKRRPGMIKNIARNFVAV